jgi:hypothetical protein
MLQDLKFGIEELNTRIFLPAGRQGSTSFEIRIEFRIIDCEAEYSKVDQRFLK